MQIHMQLATLKKNDLSTIDYYNHIKSLTNTLTAAGAPLRDDEIIAYMLTCLSEEYDSLMTSVTTRAEPMSLSDIYTTLVSFENHLLCCTGGADTRAGPGVNFASHGGHHPGGRSGGRSGGRGGGHNGGHFWWPGGPTNGDHPWCQICGCPNHTAPQCWYNYDDGYQAEEKASAAMVTTPSYSVDAPWYSDMGTTDHITNDLDRLAVRDKYQGKVQIQTVGSILSVHRFT
jgi:hypothetical protein